MQKLNTVVVAEDLARNFVLGTNFLLDNHANLNFATRLPTLSLFDDMVQIPMRPCCDDTNCASVNHTAVIPAYSEAYVTEKTPKRFNNSNVLLENAERVCSISVAGALAFFENNKTVCRILNANPCCYTKTRHETSQCARA